MSDQGLKARAIALPDHGSGFQPSMWIRDLYLGLRPRLGWRCAFGAMATKFVACAKDSPNACGSAAQTEPNVPTFCSENLGSNFAFFVFFADKKRSPTRIGGRAV